MDGGGDVALSIRRAKRSRAKRLDLSRRGLRSWPEELWGLKEHLESLDLSGNELVSIDNRLAELESLQELNLADNSISEVLQPGALDALPRLSSLVLDGNPVGARLGAPTLRQLAQPGPTPGQTSAQAIRNLLAISDGSGGSRPVGGRSGSPDTLTAVEAVCMSAPSSRPSTAGRRPQHAALSAGVPSSDAIEQMLSVEGDGAAWRKQQRMMQQELETLQARVKELEASEAERGATYTAASDVPAWLRDSADSKRLSDTLPSRRGDAVASDETDQVRGQFQEEQRKNKRLEQEINRLSQRLSESDLNKGSVGSVPHFEWSEVELLEQIGQGGFSVVHKAQWHSTKVCMKKIFDPNITEELLAEFDNEVAKLEQIRHPNILLMLAVHRRPPALSIVTELVDGGSLFQLLHQPQNFNSVTGPFSDGVPYRDIMQIMETSGVAIAYLHARGIVHRDIKSHNVLLSPRLEAKLCDFGLARMRSELNTGTMQFAGTPQYMAPEIFRGQKYSDKIDVWAYGTMLWEVMAVDIPFANLDAVDIKEKVFEGQMMPIPAATPAATKQIIQDCWTLDPAARPAMSAALLDVQEALSSASAPNGPARRPGGRRPMTAMS